MQGLSSLYVCLGRLCTDGTDLSIKGTSSNSNKDMSERRVSGPHFRKVRTQH